MGDEHRQRVGQGVLTPPQGLPAVPPATAPCLCGHEHDCHRHWRPGSDCGSCGCAAFRYRDGAVRRLLRGLGLIG